MNHELLEFLKFVYGSANVTGKESIFTKVNLENLRQRKGFIQEVAGRDSIAAFKKFLFYNKEYDYVLLSLAFAPSEFGKLRYPLKALEKAQIIAAEEGLEVIVSVSKSVSLWRKLVSASLIENSLKFGFFSPCIGCHLYLHILRGYLAVITGAKVIVSGERIYHGEKIKINQALPCINAYAEVLNSIGVELVFPVADAKNEEYILELLQDKWEEGKEQMDCLFSGTSSLTSKSYEELKKDIERYLKEWLVPLGKEVLGGFTRTQSSV